MDTDLIKSIIGVIAASIPLVVAIVALGKGRLFNIAEANDKSLKVLKVKREQVDQKYWKEYQLEQVVISVVLTVLLVFIYCPFMLYTLGQIKNPTFVLIINFLFIDVCAYSLYLLRKKFYQSYVITIKDAYDGRYFLFQNISLEVEADYHYLFNKCFEVFKILKFPVVEIDKDLGILESFISFYSFSNEFTGSMKVKISPKNNIVNVYIVHISITMFHKTSPLTLLKYFSMFANRFVNLMISKIKCLDQEVGNKSEVSEEVSN